MLKVAQLNCVLRKKVAMIEIDQESCRTLETALSREWLETDANYIGDTKAIRAVATALTIKAPSGPG